MLVCMSVQACTAPKLRVAPVCRAFSTIEAQNPYAEELKKVAQHISKTGKGILVSSLYACDASHAPHAHIHT